MKEQTTGEKDKKTKEEEKNEKTQMLGQK